jgi:hypothetical protein
MKPVGEPDFPKSKLRITEFRAAAELARMRPCGSEGSSRRVPPQSWLRSAEKEDNRARGWLKQQFPGLTVLTAIEVKHVVQRTGNCVERTACLNTIAEQPVFLDKSYDRALVD